MAVLRYSAGTLNHLKQRSPPNRYLSSAVRASEVPTWISDTNRRLGGAQLPLRTTLALLDGEARLQGAARARTVEVGYLQGDRPGSAHPMRQEP